MKKGVVGGRGAGTAKQHCHVCIMAAGMHAAGKPADVLNIVGFLHQPTLDATVEDRSHSHGACLWYDTLQQT